MADLGKVVVTDGGNYSASVTYEKLTFVHYQGDAYMTLKTVKGVTPTDDGTNYKLFCKSAELATATKAGIVLPDGTTTTVDGNGKISVKKATTSAAGIVKPAATDFIMAADGTQKINTQFTQATELANIIAGEAIAQVWGKVSKAIATTMNLDQNALLKNMISNIAVNDPDKLNSAAYIYTLVERIGMGTELAVGANLTDGLNKVNSDLAVQAVSNIDIRTLGTGRYYATNCTNLPPNWVAAYLDVERLDDLWCHITAWPPYDGLESPQIIKCYGGTWGSWWVLFASDTMALLGLIGADFLYDPNTDACIVKWRISHTLHYQLVLSSTGISFDRWDGTTWINVWRK